MNMNGDKATQCGNNTTFAIYILMRKYLVELSILYIEHSHMCSSCGLIDQVPTPQMEMISIENQKRQSFDDRISFNFY